MKDYKFKVTPSFMFIQFSNFFNINKKKWEYNIQLKYDKNSMSKLRYNSVRLFNNLTPSKSNYCYLLSKAQDSFS